jgi:hypothetical protein
MFTTPAHHGNGQIFLFARKSDRGFSEIARRTSTLTTAIRSSPFVRAPLHEINQ